MKPAFPDEPSWPDRVVPRFSHAWVLWLMAGVLVGGMGLAAGAGLSGQQIRRGNEDLRARALSAGADLAQQELLAERNSQRYVLTGDTSALDQLQQDEQGIKRALEAAAALVDELAPWAPNLGTSLEATRARLWEWRSSYSMRAIEYRMAGRWEDLEKLNRGDSQAHWNVEVDAAIRNFRARLEAALIARETARRPESTAVGLLFLLGLGLDALVLLAAVPFALRPISELRYRNRLSSALKTFTRSLRSADNETEITATVARAAMAGGGVERVHVLLPRTEPAGLRVAVAVGLDLPDRRGSAILDQPGLCPVIRANRPHLVADVRAQAPCDCPLGVPPRGAYACIPVITEGRASGLLNVQAANARSIEPEHVRDYLEAVGFVGSLALGGHYDLTKVQREAMLDGLTGVYNRRFLDASLKHQFAAAGRTSNPLSILMMDIDHFKKLNDTYGHWAGDAVLQALGRHIQPLLRETDILARYGGEEFMVLLPNTTAEQAMAIAEKIRLHVRSLAIPGLESIPPPIATISVGVASFPHDGKTREGLLLAVDMALYLAKGGGRDQVRRLDRPNIMLKGE